MMLTDYYNNMSDKIKILTDKYIDMWYTTSSDFPQFDKRYSKTLKEENTKATNLLLKLIINKVLDLNETEESYSLVKQYSIEQVKSYILNIMQLNDEESTILLSKGYIEVIEDFLNRVRKFNKNIIVSDIFQALSNVWVMNSIQLILNKPIKLTSAIFGYSLLYPYLDNYLDNVTIDIKQKKLFNKQIRTWLKGEEVTPFNEYEEQVFYLLNTIESDYNREKYSEVYNSLLAIQSGQEKSLEQQSKKSIPYETDILRISFEKGGTSVLADAYLVKGILTKEEIDFFFGYGVFLQLLDDLEDTILDKKNGHMTIFSQLSRQYPLDNMANKLFNFIDRVLNEHALNLNKNANTLLQIFGKITKIMVTKAILNNKKMYTKKYISIINQYYYLDNRYNILKAIKKDIKQIDIKNLQKQLNENYQGFQEEIIWLLLK